MIPQPALEARQAPPRLSVLDGQSAGALVSRHARVATKLAAAEREVLVVSSLSGGPADPVSTFRPVDHANLGRGVRYRMLVPDAARTTPGPARRLGKLAQAGAEIRTMPVVPVEALVIDGALAVLPGEHRDIAVLRLPSVIGTIMELVEHLWPAAVPLVPADPPSCAELAGRDRELLALLSAGCTDESAAAALGVSVRTVRRMVAGLMNRLGARSRFQAGVKAAGHGWLAGRAS
ncbi:MULTISPECIES: helix-turn-helix transcriptional regulator [Amycolatopsis]|uniref:HTH luxR-type domain-containing protein n=2 Tax=Amycolatopsis TaxID=1813 RepID=A0ABP7HMA9_9PSEU|nr:MULTISPECIES: helix-turn-helix transcriptional regulator [Amycolatopsis]MCF6421176.1 helix-turn-helix transcriptional regulator [Amycolatopsis tucumanensis]